MTDMPSFKNYNIREEKMYTMYDNSDMIGPTIAHNLNTNISNIIDDVKRQRMDIIKLNNELKNSRNFLDQRNFDDMRNRQELNIMFRNMKKEKEFLEMELRNTKNNHSLRDDKLREKDDMISQLKIRVNELERNLNNKKNDLENCNYKMKRLNLEFDDYKQDKDKKVFSGLEQELLKYQKMYREEADKNNGYKKEIEEYKNNLEELAGENDRVELKMNQKDNLIKELKIKIEERVVDNKLKSELVYDYHVFNTLKNNIDMNIESIQNMIQE